MVLNEEVKRISAMNRADLEKYRSTNKEMLIKAKAKREELRQPTAKKICRPGEINPEDKAFLMASIEVAQLEQCRKATEKRMLELLTPAEKRAREDKRKALLNELEMLKA